MKTRYFRLENGNKVDLNMITDLAKLAVSLQPSSYFDSIESHSQLFGEVKNFILMLHNEMVANSNIDSNLIECYNLLNNDTRGKTLLYNAVYFQIFMNYFISKGKKNEIVPDSPVSTEFAKLTLTYDRLVNEHLVIGDELENVNDNKSKLR